MPDAYRALVLEGSSTRKPLAPEGTPDSPRNLAVVFSRYDEFPGDMWHVPAAAQVSNSKRLQSVSFDQLPDIRGVERLDLAAILQGRLEKPHPGSASVEPVRTRRRLVRADHDRARAALTEAIQAGESVTRIAERLRLDVATLAQHKEPYDQVRRETRERKAAAVSARQEAAIASAEAVAVKLVQGKCPSRTATPCGRGRADTRVTLRRRPSP